MDSNEEYVRRRCKIGEFDLECSHGGSWRFKEDNPLHVLGWFGWTTASPDALGKLWQAAADFTREREEQIRQAEREIWLLDNKIKTFTPAIDRAMEAAALFAAELVREQYAWYRILSARQAALAELRRGMKQAEARYG